MLTWPGGWAMPDSWGYWRAYVSPDSSGDAKREFHLVSIGGRSHRNLIVDDYGFLVPVAAP